MEATTTNEILVALEAYKKVADDLARENPTNQFYHGIAWAYAVALGLIQRKM